MNDMLIMTESGTVEAVQNSANIALVTVTGQIQALDLQLAINKTKAVMFTSFYEIAEP